MNTLISAILEFFGFTMNVLWVFMVDVAEWIQQLATEAIPNAVWALMPAGVTDFIDSINLTDLGGIVDAVTWFIPFWTIMAIYTTAYAMAGGIRLVRFIIGWIPTIEG